MKSLGVERIISLSAVGSLKEEHRPLDFVIPDQFFDRTRGRVSTFFGEGLVAHISFADPICPRAERGGGRGLRRAAGVNIKKGGTYLCMEGPAFSTKAESNVYRSWGMDVIGMTNLQEAKLAREAEICYVTVAMVTDYDCWHPDHDAVTVNEIIANLNEERRKRVQSGGRSGRRDARGRAAASAARRWPTPSSPTASWCRKPRARSWGFWLTSTSCSEIARELLAQCLAGRPPAELPPRAGGGAVRPGAVRNSGGRPGRPLRAGAVRRLRAPVRASRGPGGRRPGRRRAAGPLRARAPTAPRRRANPSACSCFRASPWAPTWP